MKKGFLYPDGDKVNWNPKEMPDTSNFGNDAVKAEYGEWESNNIEIDNMADTTWHFGNNILIDGEVWNWKPGQQAVLNGKTIIKLI